MKKTAFIATLMLAFAGNAFAVPAAKGGRSESGAGRWYNSRPSVEDSRFLLGVHFGPNFNSVSTESGRGPNVETSGRTRLMTGLTTQLNLLNWFAIETDVNYVQRGGELNNVNGQQGVNATFSYNYLEFPILARFQYSVIDGFRPFFMTGPSVGFMLSKSGTVIDAQGRERELPDSTFNGKYSSTNFSWNFALGGDIDVAKQWALTLDARYAIGMSNILTRAGQDGDTKAAQNLNGFQLMAGVKMSML